MIKKVVMPAAGQTTDIATVTKLMVQVGAPVKKGDVLLEVETDKAVLPIESFARGFVTEIFVNEFDTVDAGTPLLAIGDAADLEAAKNKAPAESTSAPAAEDDDEDDFVPVMPKTESTPAPTPVKVSPSGKAMPNAKKLAAELGVDLEGVVPANGEFIKASDVRRAAESIKAPEITPAAEETIPTARMRSTLARRWDAFVPTFTVTVSASDSAYLSLAAKKAGITPAHYVMMAVSRLALKYPILRAVNDGGKLPLSEGCDVGLAVFAENGTVTSVVSSAEKLGVSAIAERCEENFAAVLKGDLSSVYPCSVSVYDACGYNVEGFAPPVCAPGVAALGVCASDGSIRVSGSFDIRVIEGNVGASIMADLREYIENPVLMLI